MTTKIYDILIHLQLNSLNLLVRYRKLFLSWMSSWNLMWRRLGPRAIFLFLTPLILYYTVSSYIFTGILPTLLFNTKLPSFFLVHNYLLVPSTCTCTMLLLLVPYFQIQTKPLKLHTKGMKTTLQTDKS